MDLRTRRIKELENSIIRFNTKLIALQKKSRSFGYYRLFIFLLGLLLFLFSFFYLTQLITWIFLAIVLIAWGIVTSIFNKIELEIKKCKLWIRIKKDSLARMRLDWSNIPNKDFTETLNDHPFESDLNITGKNSLLQLLDVSTSKEGCEKLKDWLLIKIPSGEIILERQEIIKELIPLSGFRHKLILNANLSSRKRLEGSRLSDWLRSASNAEKIKRILNILIIIIPINVLFLILFILQVIPAYWTIGVLIYIGIYWFNIKYINELFDKALDIKSEFGQFSQILDFLEKYPALQNPENKRLYQFSRIFFENKNTPSGYFKRLNRITYAASFQKNPFIELFLNSLVPYDFIVALKLEKVKEEMSNKLPGWLEVFYNLEALISLSNFAYLNPDYIFPSIKKENHLFTAEKIAHPLIPYDTNIHNDFSLTKKGEVVIITGSNMSGKSTFLKTVGTNLVLAFTGTVVNASKFDTDLFRIVTCINISDSITDGISYFYAEVKRLKLLLDEIKLDNAFPVFYLIDEIFKGTNNLERLIGSRSYIKNLSGLNGTGLISTHDLELIKLESSIPEVSNYHFKEEVAEGKMLFDYKLRKGPSPTTNALKIMEIEGLPIEKA
jgi:ABC-type multidrug transport system fused ATPase/permease subunit